MRSDEIRAKPSFALCFAMLCVILAQAACESDPIAPQSTTVGLIPLQTGNLWKFKRTYFDTLGNITSMQPDADSVFIKADTIISNEMWFYRRYLGHDLAYRNTPSGVVTRLVSARSSSASYLLYKYPAQIGETLGYPIVYFSGLQAWLVDTVHIATVMSLDTMIYVPAGSFRCLQYRIRRPPEYSTWQDEFVAPEQGWIKTDSYSRGSAVGRIFKANSTELTKISINK